MTKVACLNEKYSTTRLVTKEKPEITNNTQDKFESILFLPKGKNRKGEGGLRTKGYYKKSYDGNPLISVITVVLNGVKYLEETILSVINQTYSNVEYIIIDGGSTDGTIDIIKKYEDKIDYWASERDEGIYDAWNKGVRLSLGKWMSFLGAGDNYVKEALNKYIKTDNLGELDYITSKVMLYRHNKKIREIGKPWNWNEFQKNMKIAHVGSLHNRKMFCYKGLFNTKFKIAGDYEFLYRFGECLKAKYIGEVLCYMDADGVSNVSSNVFKENLKLQILHNPTHFKIFLILNSFIAFIKWKIRCFFD